MTFLCDRRNNNGQSCGTIKKYEISADHLNYYLPHCGTTGITDVKSYARIVYENVFPNINFHLYSNSRGPKFYFEIKPGGNPNDINLFFSGQDSITTISSSLQMYLGAWQLIFPVAYAYQIDASSATTMLIWSPIWIHAGGGSVSVATGTYDPGETLVIAIGPGMPLGAGDVDANLDWSVYYGGNGIEEGGRLAAYGDAVYHGMTVFESNFPAENGEIYTPISISMGEWYISKFIDTKREWATYYGGSRRDELANILVINNEYTTTIGDIWVGGVTNSNDVTSGSVVPAGSFRQSFNAGATGGYLRNDGLLASFKSDDGQLRFNTYFGGAGSDDAITAIAAADDHNYIYIAGFTNHATEFIHSSLAQTTGKFPVYAGPLSNYYFKGAKADPDECDGFIARFHLQDMSMDWSTLFGGDKTERITAAELNGTGLYIAGYTFSDKLDEYPSPTISHSADRFPLSKKSGAFFKNSINNGYPVHMFVSHFQYQVPVLDWSTLLGGSAGGIQGIVFNSKNDMYILGTGLHKDGFAYSSPHGNTLGLVPTYNSGSSYYEVPTGANPDRMALLKFNTLHQLTWATKLHTGSHYAESLWPRYFKDGLAIDENDIIYVASAMSSKIYGAVPTFYLSGAYWQEHNAFDIVSGASGYTQDNFLMGFDNTNQMKWATFFGGADNLSLYGSLDQPTDIVINNGYLYLTGETTCSASPYTYWPYSYSYQDDTYAPGQDVFISRFKNKIIPTSINENDIESLALSIYPNPVWDVFTLSFVNDGSISTGEKLKIVVTDVVGKIISETEWSVTSGTNRFRIDVDGLPAGTYFVNVSGAGKDSVSKLIKL